MKKSFAFKKLFYFIYGEKEELDKEELENRKGKKKEIDNRKVKRNKEKDNRKVRKLRI